MYTESGNRLRRIASRLLAKDTVFEIVQGGLRVTLEARRAVDRNVGRVLAGLNVPSNQEVELLVEEVRALDRELSQLSVRIERLAEEAENGPPANGR
ncbi:MAG: hypothetical protein RIT81_19310 [Deltaproteobacteria bacterium]